MKTIGMKTFAAIQHGRIKDGRLTFQEGIWVQEDGFFSVLKNTKTNKFYVLRGSGSKNNYGLTIGQMIGFSQRYNCATYIVVSFHKNSNDVMYNAPLINLK